MFIPYLRFILILLLAIPLHLLAADYSRTANYANPDYGFVAHLPRKMPICTTPAPGSNHGFVALLRSDSCAEGAYEQQPRIEVFAMYDTIVMANEAVELSSDTCGTPSATRTGMLSAGVPVYECPGAKTGSVVLQRYFFLRTRPKEAGVIFNVSLYTMEEKSKADLDLVKKLLAGIRWTGAKPVK